MSEFLSWVTGIGIFHPSYRGFQEIVHKLSLYLTGSLYYPVAKTLHVPVSTDHVQNLQIRA